MERETRGLGRTVSGLAEGTLILFHYCVQHLASSTV